MSTVTPVPLVFGDYALEDRYRLGKGRVYMTGIQALVRLPMMQRQRDLAAGLNTGGFISGYRGSPLGMYDNALWGAKRYLKENNIHFQPGLNEDLAATAVWGSQQTNLFPGATVDGVFSIWYGKGPGVDRSMDVLKHGNAAGTSQYGGVIALAGDDHGCQSSTLPHQSEQVFAAAMIPVVNPATVQEYLDFGMLGFALNQTLFYEGLNLSTPVDASLIHVLNPILVMVFATLIIGEKITWKKSGGIALGATGVLILILNGQQVSLNGDHALGNLLIFLNMVFYALYLVLLKPLVAKYHTATILKWVSLFGLLFILPLSVKPALTINFAAITSSAWMGIFYVIFLNTFVAYLLINFALKTASTTFVSYYSYLQPVIAAAMSVTVGQGGITLPKTMAALLIFAGVYIVNRPNKGEIPEKHRLTGDAGSEVLIRNEEE